MEKLQYIVVAGLIKKDNKFLVVFKHSSSSNKCLNRWELPGGRAGFGLDFDTALKEKLKDYLGVNVTSIKILPKVFSNISEERQIIKHFYVLAGQCELAHGSIQLNNNKLSEYKWITLDEAEKMYANDLLVDGDLEFIRMSI